MGFCLTTIASLTTHTVQQLNQALAGLAIRWDASSRLALASTMGGSVRRGAVAFRPRQGPGMLARAVRAAHDIYALARHAEAGRPEAHDADLAEARLRATAWQRHAEAGARRIDQLERRLASSEMTVLDLRARIVCLQGKLATSTATARYQTLALALETQTRGDEEVGQAPPTDASLA